MFSFGAPCGARLALPWQPDKNDVTRDIASPFAYGKVRVDYPVLKEFSDAEIYEGMGDYVRPGPAEPWPPGSQLDICQESHARQQPDFKRDSAASHAAPPTPRCLRCLRVVTRGQVMPREPTTTAAAAVPLEARVYQVLIPLSAIYLVATLIPGSPFNNGGAPSA